MLNEWVALGSDPYEPARKNRDLPQSNSWPFLAGPCAAPYAPLAAIAGGVWEARKAGHRTAA
jgi:hypothetical protein